ncbi:Sensor histidine kinase [Minicystis rosea]|nr:Sensor histidine kinase [Minicystis rosea]
MNALHRVVAAHPNILDPEAFDELNAEIASLIRFDRLGLLVPDGPLSLRLFAQSNVPDSAIPFGTRLGGVPEVWQRLFHDQLPHFAFDMTRGPEVERQAARDGLRAYAAFPIRVSAGPPPSRARPSMLAPTMRTIGVLSLSFFAEEGVRALPVSLVQEIADAIGPSVERALVLARAHRLAMILETSGDAMLAWDREGVITDANRAAVVLTGRGQDELIGVRITDLLVPPPVPGDPTAADGVRLSLLARGPYGPRRIPVAATVTAVHGDALVAAHALLRDLSLVVVAEEQAALRLARIRELEEAHRTLLDNAPFIIFRLDPATGRLVFLSRHAERLLGVPTAEALSAPGFLRNAHADAHGVAAFDAAVARARAGSVALPYEARLRRRDGVEINVRGTVYPLLAEGASVAAIEGVLADVSAEHEARTRLVQADRLSTLGTLAAGVAHEINNPAAFILLGLDMLGRMLSGAGVQMEESVAESAGETLRELRDSIRRIVDIARDLRLFTSPPGNEGGQRTIVDVNRTVESALSLTRGQILERAQIERRLDEVPPVVMDDGRLGQVVVNLLVNAAQAIPKTYAGDQRITVATRSDGRTVVLEVTDTGTGIAPEDLSRIWQPFFTTKGPAVGTGLGLSISREIVERAGGTIHVDSPVPGSDPPCGARFMITLPAAGDDEPVTPRASPVPDPSPEPVRVLIVEDEAALARALSEEIGRYHEVTLAPGGEAGLQRLSIEAFDVVLCDLRMPDLSGEALYAKVLEHDEAQAGAFVFMTGVGFGADVERFLMESGRPVLEKPFSAEAALDAIAKVVKRRSVV